MGTKEALQVVLDNVDYMKQNCKPTDMVAAALSHTVIEGARAAIAAAERRWLYVVCFYPTKEGVGDPHFEHLIVEGAKDEDEAYAIAHRAKAMRIATHWAANDYVVKI